MPYTLEMAIESKCATYKVFIALTFLDECKCCCPTECWRGIAEQRLATTKEEYRLPTVDVVLRVTTWLLVVVWLL